MWPRKLSPSNRQLRDDDSETQSFTADDAEKSDPVVYMSNPRRSGLQRVREVFFAATALLCLWIAMVAAWRTTLHPVQRALKYEKQQLSCGNTTEEAEGNGCVFDLLSHNWMPQPCVDYEIMAEFREYVRSPERKYSAWPYYVDREGKELDQR